MGLVNEDGVFAFSAPPVIHIRPIGAGFSKGGETEPFRGAEIRSAPPFAADGSAHDEIEGIEPDPFVDVEMALEHKAEVVVFEEGEDVQSIDHDEIRGEGGGGAFLNLFESGPEGDVGGEDDRGGGGHLGEVFLEPGDLFRGDVAAVAAGVAGPLDRLEENEMDAADVERAKQLFDPDFFPEEGFGVFTRGDAFLGGDGNEVVVTHEVFHAAFEAFAEAEVGIVAFGGRGGVGVEPAMDDIASAENEIGFDGVDFVGRQFEGGGGLALQGGVDVGVKEDPQMGGGGLDGRGEEERSSGETGDGEKFPAGESGGAREHGLRGSGKTDGDQW